MDDTAVVAATVIDIRPITGKGRILALASVELLLDGVAFVIHGVQVVRTKHPVTGQEATGVDLPRYRAADGSWQQAITLPEALRRPLGEAVLEECCRRGITRALTAAAG